MIFVYIKINDKQTIFIFYTDKLYVCTKKLFCGKLSNLLFTEYCIEKKTNKTKTTKKQKIKTEW